MPQMNAEAWAAWVQAIGSIAAIISGVVLVWWQDRRVRTREEAERKSRGDVIAFRISVWVGVVGSVIDAHLDLLNDPALPRSSAAHIANALLFVDNTYIRDMLSDLHYLRPGSADVAQLHSFFEFYGAHLNRGTRLATGRAGETDAFMESTLEQLRNMKKLHINVANAIAPILERVVKTERRRAR